MRHRIEIKRQIISDERKTIGQTEVAKPCARVIPRNLLCISSIRYGEKSFQKGVQSHRLVPLTAKDDRPLKPKLKFARRPERKPLRMGIRTIRIRMPLQASIKKVISNRSQNPRHHWNTQWLNTVDAK